MRARARYSRYSRMKEKLGFVAELPPAARFVWQIMKTHGRGTLFAYALRKMNAKQWLVGAAGFMFGAALATPFSSLSKSGLAYLFVGCGGFLIFAHMLVAAADNAPPAARPHDVARK